MREQIMGRFVGARVRRVEDGRLLSGRGRYVDDVVVPNMVHAAFVLRIVPQSPQWPDGALRPVRPADGGGNRGGEAIRC